MFIQVFPIGVKETRRHPREPKASLLWQIFDKHYDNFERNYPEKFEKRYGFFRSVILEVVRAYLRCGDLKEGFARVRCPNCGHEFLLQLICYSYYTSSARLVSLVFFNGGITTSRSKPTIFEFIGSIVCLTPV